MAQLNVHITPEFDEALRRFMRLRGLENKSEAVRLAVWEGLERAEAGGRACDFGEWLGAAVEAPVNPRPRFSSDDDLWG